MFLYDVLGRFPTREEALIALAEYNKNPYSVSDREITFSQLYEKFYKNKYEMGGKTYSQSSINCTKSAYKHCSALYDIAYRKLRADDFRDILGQKNNKGNALSHALQEHIKNLFTQMDKFARRTFYHQRTATFMEKQRFPMGRQYLHRLYETV